MKKKTESKKDRKQNKRKKENGKTEIYEIERKLESKRKNTERNIN